MHRAHCAPNPRPTARLGTSRNLCLTRLQRCCYLHPGPISKLAPPHTTCVAKGAFTRGSLAPHGCPVLLACSRCTARAPSYPGEPRPQPPRHARAPPPRGLAVRISVCIFFAGEEACSSAAVLSPTSHARRHCTYSPHATCHPCTATMAGRYEPLAIATARGGSVACTERSPHERALHLGVTVCNPRNRYGGGENACSNARGCTYILGELPGEDPRSVAQHPVSRGTYSTDCRASTPQARDAAERARPAGFATPVDAWVRSVEHFGSNSTFPVETNHFFSHSHTLIEQHHTYRADPTKRTACF